MDLFYNFNFFFDSVCFMAVLGGFVKYCVTGEPISSLNLGLELSLPILDVPRTWSVSWYLLHKRAFNPFLRAPLTKQDFLSRRVKESQGSASESCIRFSWASLKKHGRVDETRERSHEERQWSLSSRPQPWVSLGSHSLSLCLSLRGVLFLLLMILFAWEASFWGRSLRADLESTLHAVH